MKKRVAYQGVEGSFSSLAARALYGDNIIALHTHRFREIFEKITNGEADVGVVPIENALAGSVHENYDLLQEFDCAIVAEYYCPVRLHLLSKSPLEKIQRVFSHPKALEQCSRFLEAHPHLQVVVFSDTAGAALHVATSLEPGLGAIASEEAAKTYGLTIVQRCIQNHETNVTRFVAITASPHYSAEPTKASMIVNLPHEPGSLYRLLGEIAAANINLTKIESRPILGKPFEYAFHIDLQSPQDATTPLSKAIENLKPHVRALKLLGMYNKA